MGRDSRIVRREIKAWTERGVIDLATADRLLADVDARASRNSASSVLVVMSALLFAAGILIFIAANWEAMPRMGRVALLAAIILVSNGTGAWAASLGRTYLADALWLIGSAAFGAGMALVGQMYHLSGSDSGLFLTWWIAAVVSAVALGSRSLTVASVALAIAWPTTMAGEGIWGERDLPLAVHAFPFMLAASFAASLRTCAVGARDLVLLSLAAYVFMLYAAWGVAVPIVTMMLSAGIFSWTANDKAKTIEGVSLQAHPATHALLHFLMAGALLHVEWPSGVPLALVATIILAGLIAALLIAGRDARGVRLLVYAAFAAELVFVYIQTIGTMLGTFGFLTLAAIALAVFARLVTRFENRMALARQHEARP